MIIQEILPVFQYNPPSVHSCHSHCEAASPCLLNRRISRAASHGHWEDAPAPNRQAPCGQTPTSAGFGFLVGRKTLLYHDYNNDIIMIVS